MTKISATDIAFEGLRLAREQPRAVVVWAGLLLVFNFVVSALFVGLAGPALTEVTRLQRSGQTDPQAMVEAFAGLAPSYLVVLIPALLVYGVLFAAIYRAVLRPSEGGPGFLRFGADELRQVLALLAYAAVMILVYLLATVVAVFVAGFLGTVSGPALAGVVAVVAILGAVFATLAVGVRLSLATPMTFVEERLRVFASWGATKPVFWPLLGAYVLNFFLIAVISLLALMLFAALAALLLGGVDAVVTLFAPDYSSLAAYFSPALIVSLIINSVIGALVLALSAGASAEAYRQIVGLSPGQAADTFA